MNIIKPVIIGVIINIMLTLLLTPLATKDEVKPPDGASKLSYKSQFMHMIVHHGQVLFTSSLIVAVLVGLSVR